MWLLRLISAFVITSTALSCDEFSVEEVDSQFKTCTSGLVLNEEGKVSCEGILSYLECTPILELCLHSEDAALDVSLDRLKEDLNVVTDEELEEILGDSCLVGETDNFRSKRSPKRGGGGGSRGGGSRSSSSSRGSSWGSSSPSSSRGSSSSRSGSTRSRVTSAVKKIFGGSSKPKVPKVKKPKSKSKIKKVAKYAVAGLAAYGAYKLGKKMAKGLRKRYDDDDCWEYSPFQDQYRCTCNEECNIYVGSATAVSASTLTALTSLAIFATIINNRVFI